MGTIASQLSTVTPFAANLFDADVAFLETHWQRACVAGVDLPIIDLGQGTPLVFVPILEHLEFVYARQIQTFCQSRRVILYRRHESRTHFIGLSERVEELRQVLDELQITAADFVAHGDAAMVLFEFALRYPARCRSLIIVAQGADYQIAPHPFIWLLHEVFLRLPVQRFVPTSLLRNTVLRYITHTDPTLAQSGTTTLRELPRELIEKQFRKIRLWPALYRYSVLPIIHNFDIRSRIKNLTMPILLINRQDDALSPEAKTNWLARQLPVCAGYHVVPGRERFFLYSEAEQVNPLIQAFLITFS